MTVKKAFDCNFSNVMVSNNLPERVELATIDHDSFAMNVERLVVPGDLEVVVW